MTIELPQPLDTHDAVMDDGAVVRLRRHGNAAGPRLILVHGNGFATDAYYPFWQHFLPDFEILIHDLRNHGQNPYCGSLGHSIRQFALDHATIADVIAERYGPKPTVGIYHSISSLAAILQAVDRGLIWDGVVFVDPPLIPEPGHALRSDCFKFELVLANWAMKRPNEFTSPGELAEQFRDNKMMQRWVDGAHDLLAQSILRQEDGVWRLVCPRELEASAYTQNAYSDIWQRLPGLQAHKDKILFLGADEEVEHATPNTRIGKVLAQEYGFRIDIIERSTHMLQIEQPEVCVESVRRFIGDLGVGV